MKVLFVFHETGQHNGAWKSAQVLLSNLRKFGVEILIMTPDRKEIYVILKNEGYNVVSNKIVWNIKSLTTNVKGKLFFRFLFKTRRIFLSILWWVRSIYIVKKFNPDIIHTNSSVFYQSYDLAKFFKLSHVWHIREYGDLDFSVDLSNSNKRLLEGYSYNICIARDLMAYRGLYDDVRTSVIYNGFFDDHNFCFIFPKNNYLLYVGSLVEGKGISDIIDAWIKYKLGNCLSDYVLRIVGGNSNEIAYWQKYISSFGDYLCFFDFLGKRNDVQELMSHSRCVIMASYHEAFGRVTAEAMYYGTIVVGRDEAGTKEQFDNGIKIKGREIALRFNDKSELEKQIATVISMEDKDYLRIINDAHEVVEELYSAELTAKMVLGVYNSILRDK